MSSQILYAWCKPFPWFHWLHRCHVTEGKDFYTCCRCGREEYLNPKEHNSGACINGLD